MPSVVMRRRDRRFGEGCAVSPTACCASARSFGLRRAAESRVMGVSQDEDSGAIRFEARQTRQVQEGASALPSEPSVHSCSLERRGEAVVYSEEALAPVHAPSRPRQPEVRTVTRTVVTRRVMLPAGSADFRIALYDYSAQVRRACVSMP